MEDINKGYQTYIKSHKINELFASLAKEVIMQQPDDIVVFLIEELEKHKKKKKKKENGDVE